MLRYFFPLLLVFSFLCSSADAREGMWLPLLIEKFNIEEMHQKGYKLTAEDIYSINSASMKDGVVIFGGGCSGGVISDKGLLLTNHHCAYSLIQSHSTVEEDYLTHGFVAQDYSEEMVNPNLSVTFLKYMEEVTDYIFKGVDDDMSEAVRDSVISENSRSLERSVTEDTHYDASVESFYFGNSYYLFVYEEFNDVRMVAVPPSSIGKFGGDTDNWVWPRHSGDFAFFRIYADKDNNPARYSVDNVPYRPAYSFPISISGVNEGDFTMLMGYPGSTFSYSTSHHIEMLTQYVYPVLIDMRSLKLDVMNYYMDSDDKVRIAYAAKNSSVSNAWKRWQGEINGLERFEVINKKSSFERDFDRWVEEEPDKRVAYKGLTDGFEQLYSDYKEVYLARLWFLEVIGRNGIETLRTAAFFDRLAAAYSVDEPDNTFIEGEKERIEELLNTHFKDFYLPIDTAIAYKLFSGADTLFTDEIYEPLDNIFSIYSETGEPGEFFKEMFNSTPFSDAGTALDYLHSFDGDAASDYRSKPEVLLYNAMRDVYNNVISPVNVRNTQKLDSLKRLYIDGIKKFVTDEKIYPDANFTMRLSYGSAGGYTPSDAVWYNYYTTGKGVLEKYRTGDPDYYIDQRLIDLLESGDFGRYGNEKGELPVCFVATNHTSGGNSGSVVINHNGEIVGINFDRAWDGVMSDLYFSDKICRNISVDIRYILYILDEYMDADYIIDELDIKM
ncbi:S46 family peptidase [Marinilabiliaceae bacterium ANBcel2]|nr:S46 family peptidase [Marinilabiliaceae bacterium ANBcel2]